MQLKDQIPIFGEHDEATVKQIETCLRTGGERAALMADGHLGYAQPIGGVVAYKNRVSISGVGFDIACGNLACKTNLQGAHIRPILPRLMDEIERQISFGVGRVNATKVDHELFDDPAWGLDTLRNLKSMAAQQLGTVGSGNHYVDVFVDEDDAVWVGVHFGSRGLGHKTATAYLKAAGGVDGMNVPPTVVDLGTPLGDDYLAAMTLAGRYAYAGREYVARHVATNILGGEITEEVHNHHNYAWKETHGGEELYVVRKGATPAAPGQRGFIGGSMGDNAVIVEGVDSEVGKLSLYSTVHGAGRVMSRTAAKGKFNRKTGERLTEGAISRGQMNDWVANFGGYGVELRGGDVDEAPQAYRRLHEVLAAHAGTLRVLHTLRPIGVVMASPKIVDPYKD